LKATSENKGPAKNSLRGLMEKNLKYLMIAPTVIILGLVIIYPLIVTVNLSLHRINIINMYTDQKPFVGLANFAAMLMNADFLHSLWRSFLFVFIVVALEVILGMLLALMFQRDFPGKNIFSTLLLCATMVTPIAISLMWRFMLNQEIGIINYLFNLVFQISPSWLGSTTLAFGSIILIDIWWCTPFTFLIFMAGLSSLPAEPYEAAKIDGTTPWQVFRFVTLPLMKPIIVIVTLIRTMDALKSFEMIYGLTNGGPGTSTELISFFLYKYAFKRVDLGGGAAISLIMLVIVACLSYTLFRNLGTNETE
jgi:multiple sugar transport system permease protein